MICHIVSCFQLLDENFTVFNLVKSLREQRTSMIQTPVSIAVLIGMFMWFVYLTDSFLIDIAVTV